MSLLNQEKIASAQVGFSTVFNGVLVAQDDPARQLAMETTSTGHSEEYDWMGDVPGLTEWRDDRKISQLRVENLKLVNKDYQAAIRIQRNTILDDRLGMVKPRIEMLAQKAALHYGDLLVQALIDGFNTTSKFGKAYDGLAFFSTAHKDGDGATQSNKGTAALSATSYFSARAQMYSLKDEGADPLAIVPDTLIVGPTNEKVALEIVSAGIISNNTNVLQSTARVVVSPRLSGAYANYWFLASLKAAVRPLILQIRQPIIPSYMGQIGAGEQSEPLWRRKELYFGVDARHTVGYALWQFVFGSNGTT